VLKTAFTNVFIDYNLL